MRTTGTVVRGVRAPIIREGDDLAEIVAEQIINCSKSEGSPIRDRDIVAVTEAVVARAQGNYATVEHISKDISEKFPGGKIGVTFPILSRNRFEVCLKGIAMGAKKIVLLLQYSADEMGNHLFDEDMLEKAMINPWSDVLLEKEYRRHFGYTLHPYTGVDYVAHYMNIIRNTGCEAEVIFANDARVILDYVRDVLVSDIHTREKNKRLLREAGAHIVFGLDDILTKPMDGSGYNEKYGLLGSNKASDSRVKLFPRDCQAFVDNVQAKLLARTGRKVEVMVYGDGAYKDPIARIWEFADPVVSPGYTAGLCGTPSEIKLKYLADDQYAHLSGKELESAIRIRIAEKEGDLKGKMVSEGTTPRKYVDLIGSLCDLVSGSGDKGTPIVWMQGYFDNYAV